VQNNTTRKKRSRLFDGGLLRKRELPGKNSCSANKEAKGTRRSNQKTSGGGAHVLLGEGPLSARCKNKKKTCRAENVEKRPAELPHEREGKPSGVGRVRAGKGGKSQRLEEINAKKG